MSANKLFVAIAFSAILLKSYLLFSQAPPLDLTEIELFMSKKFTLPDSPFIIPTFVASILPNPYMLSIFLQTLSAALFVRFTKKYFALQPGLIAIAFIAFLFSPWTSYIFTYSLGSSLLMLFFLVFLHLYTSNNSKIIYPLLLIPFTTWTGLIFGLFVTPILKISLPKKFLVILLILASLILNRTLVKNTVQKSFIPTLYPKNLAEKINEKSRYSPPDLVIIRRLTHNKPLLAAQSVANHAISTLDFEQISSPLDSYSLISLSGLSPKNPKLLLIWEIPLLFYGLLELTNHKGKLMSSLKIPTAVAFIPYMFFSKTALPLTLSLLIPFLLLIEMFALKKIYQKNKIIFSVTIFTLSLSLFYSQKTFFYKPQTYRYSHPYYFKAISTWVQKNATPDDKIVITNRFGPTNLALSYYERDFPQKNIEFRPFQLSEETGEEETIYIGLIGEFVGSGKHLDQRNIPNITILDTIRGSEEIVTEYGDQIWIGKIN